MKIFIDTNIIISAAFFPNSKVSFVLSYILETHDVVISTYSIDESFKVFMNKFPDKVDDLYRFYSNIKFIKYETPKNIDKDKFPSIRDINDLPILVSAINSGADILLTGDKDFDDININKPLIYKPTEYFELIIKK